MNPLARAAYAAAAHLANLASTLAPPGGNKTLRSFSARRGLLDRYRAWAASSRDTSRPLIWIHAPSVGEGLQARPVIQLLRARQANLQIAYTFFSPSAATFASSTGADFVDYLPFDTAADADLALDALQPTALVFSKLDVWPTLVARAAARRVPIGLISATLADGSARRSSVAQLFLRDAYASLDSVGAIAEADGARLAALGVPRAHISVTGDTRYDQVWSRAQAVDRASALLAPLVSARPTVVAGSTWPADEIELFAAWRTVREKIPGARLVIAPHEPTAPHLRSIETNAASGGIGVARLGTSGAGSADIILVDRVGVLGDLYALADVAYVGGGFHGAGLHSVIEPAAFGAPVLFGPHHDASRDARLLIERGGAFAARSSSELAMRLLALLTETTARAAAGSRARAVVESELGAAERSVALVERLAGLSSIS